MSVAQFVREKTISQQMRLTKKSLQNSDKKIENLRKSDKW